VIACETPTPTVTEAKRGPALHQPMATPPALPEETVMAKPLVLVDGVATTEVEIPLPPAGRDWKTDPPRGDIRMWGLDPSTIERIEVLKPPAAEQLFGPEGRSGVVQITTKAAVASADSKLAAIEPAPAPAPPEAPTVRTRELQPGTVVLVDGQRGELDDVNPDDVERIEVFKREAARAIEPGAETVIRITTKR
jgi:hypothetical protein